MSWHTTPVSKAKPTGVGATVTEVDVSVLVEGVMPKHEQPLEISSEAYFVTHGGRSRPVSSPSAMADRLAGDGGVGRIVLVLEGKGAL